MPADLPTCDILRSPTPRTRNLVVMPVYNEMPHLGRVLRTLRRCWHGDVLAIDDNSSDLSLARLRREETIHLVHNRTNAGAGGVLLQGFRYAREKGYETVITLDADGQHTPLCIAHFLCAIDPRMDCSCGRCHNTPFVWGSRYLGGYHRLRPVYQIRQEVNRIVTRRLNAVTGYGLTDAFCGFRAYRLEALAKLDITETGYGMFMQMTVQAARAGIPVCEIPVPLIYLDATRDFHHVFRDTRHRLRYYLGVIDAETKRGGAPASTARTEG